MGGEPLTALTVCAEGGVVGGGAGMEREEAREGGRGAVRNPDPERAETGRSFPWIPGNRLQPAGPRWAALASRNPSLLGRNTSAPRRACELFTFLLAKRKREFLFSAGARLL